MRRIAIALVVLAGCSSSEARTAQVDSVVTIEEGVRRFRDGLPAATALAGGATHRDTLIARFVAAVEHGDTAAIRAMVMNRSEFAYLYYPSSAFTRPPTQQEPGLVWFLMLQDSQKGITRVFDRYARRPGAYAGHACEPAAREEAGFRYWDACLIQLREGGSVVARRLFGSIVERDGQYKFLSYANDF